MSEHSTILGYTSQASDGLLHAEARSIWPIDSWSELAVLARVARACGRRLCRVRRTSRGECAPLDDRNIAIIGAENRDAGMLYAHLTGRRAELIDTVERLRHEQFAVVVTRYQHLSLNALAHLSETMTTRPVGIVAGVSESDLRQQVLIRSAYAVLRPRDSEPRAILWGESAPISQSNIAPYRSITDDRRRAPDVLGIAGHSDGLDFELPNHQILCPVKSRNARAPRAGEPSPHCIASASCKRTHQPIEQALESARLVSSDRIRARTLLLAGCYGALGVDSLFSPETSLAASLLQGPRIGALLTSIGLARRQPGDLLYLTRCLLRGGSFAMLLPDALRARAALGEQFVLFGDPAMLTVAPRAAEAQSEPIRTPPLRIISERSVLGSEWPSPSCWTSANERARLAFLTLLLESGLRSFSRNPEATAAQAAVRVAWRERPDVAHLQRVVLRGLLAWGAMLSNSWIGFARRTRGLRLGAGRVCSGCSRNLVGERFDFLDERLAARSLLVCACCGVVEDAELSPSSAGCTQRASALVREYASGARLGSIDGEDEIDDDVESALVCEARVTLEDLRLRVRAQRFRVVGVHPNSARLFALQR